MKLDKPFDANTIAPSAPMEVIPVAWYPMTITASETKETSKKNGSMLALEFTIIDGQYKGRKFFSNLNLVNANAQAVEIAYAELSAICHATGVMVVNDSQQLHNIPMDVKVGMRKPDPTYPDPANEIKGYRRLEGLGSTNAVSAPPTLPPAAAAPAATSNAPAMPWAAAPVEAPAPIAAPAAAPVVAAPPPIAPPAAPIVVAEPVKTMTAKAAGASYESFIAQGWTDIQMIDNGYMEMVVPVTSVPSPAPAPAAGIAPPWAQ